MRHTLLNVLTIFSLVICGLVLALWIVGCWRTQEFVWRDAHNDRVNYALVFGQGGFTYSYTATRFGFATEPHSAPHSQWHKFTFGLGFFPTGEIRQATSGGEAIIVPYGFLLSLGITFPLVRYYGRRKATWRKVIALTVWTLCLAIFLPLVTIFLSGLLGAYGITAATILIGTYGTLTFLYARRLLRQRRSERGTCPN